MKLPRLKFWPAIIQRRLPRSLMGRVLLIIVAPIVIMQLIVTWVFFDMHWETVTAKLSEGMAGDVAWAVSTYETDPSDANLERITEQAKPMGLTISLLKGVDLPENRRPSLFVPLDRALNHALDNALDEPYWFDTTRYPGFLDIRVKVRQGLLRIFVPKDRGFVTTGHIFFFWIIIATAVLTTIAMLFIRNQVRAIERLADAAERFGRGEDDPGFKPYGATEVRAAARAFLEMKSRIQRQIEQRTTLLASVSHDLRTPLTRLKLELAMAAQDTATERMKQDVSEMAYMIDEYLAFARGEAGEDTDTVFVGDLIESLREGTARTGHTLAVELPSETISVRVRRLSIERAMTNLIMNGFHYGKTVRLSAVIVGREVNLNIDDDGPGIAPEKREEAFKPFSRLDEARNQNIKGVGLGLAIARDIVRGHGGNLTLDQSPMGGLRATITLPVEQVDS
ncbi:ATP-binding protein [Asticcacaulis solisilvae]|uniref:ATP-binding protein n=1 Tax=Asticcacaulis solisilvae TaxID=1217274 RepID=UPI003FD7A33F